MEDYKELIALLEGACMFKITEMTEESLYKVELFTQAADAIEELVKERDEWKTLGSLANKRAEDYREMRRQRDKAIKERDAAIADLTSIVHDMGNTCICDYCIGCVSNGFREGCKTDDGDRWEWRGTQEVELD